MYFVLLYDQVALNIELQVDRQKSARLGRNGSVKDAYQSILKSSGERDPGVPCSKGSDCEMVTRFAFRIVGVAGRKQWAKARSIYQMTSRVNRVRWNVFILSR